MKGDFTRVTFKPEKHYSGVRMQQGRAQLDADFNEYVDIQAHLARTAHRDIIGLCGGPQGQDSGGDPLAGFRIEVQDNTELHVTKGRYYVDGILCENEATIPITEQLDLPVDALTGVIWSSPAAVDPGIYLAYLDVWQRHLTALEDDTIREVALLGPDTTTRSKTIWQVKLLYAGDVGDEVTCASELAAWQEATAPSTGQLRACAEPETTETNPCEVPARAGYRGLENQLYRVQVHEVVSGSEITIKWSRENGSVVARWDEQDSLNANKLTVSSVGHDEVLGFAPDNWIELTDDKRELHGEPGLLVQITKVDGKVLTIDPGGATANINDFAPTRIVRRWDMPSELGEISVDLTVAGNWIPLEDGVQVAFEPGTYHVGDYWLIPARTATRDIEWPRDGNIAVPQPPHGIHHRYCRLAVLGFDGAAWERIHDCRKLFPPLTEMVRFCYLSGDGQEAMPGNPLLRPLQVGVVNGQMPVADATVSFRIVDGNGHLQESAAASCAAFTAGGATSIEVQTGSDGIAGCCWRLDNATQSQQVEAALLEMDGKPMVHDDGTPFLPPIRFNANLSVAEEVYYNSEKCINPDNPDTVQDALDQLCRNVALYYVGGDGQEAMPGGILPGLLQVRVANGHWPLPGAKAVFEVESGGGTLEANGDSGSLVRATTDVDGLASCKWVLGAGQGNTSQRVKAYLEGIDRLPIFFNANLSIASEVFYDSANCSDLADVSTVQEAIDVLCRAQPGGQCCCVTVGDGGEFESLDEAIRELIESRQREICICLLPGRPLTSDGLGDIVPPQPGTHLTIKGCAGAGITVNAPWRFHGLASFALHDLEIVVPELGSPVASIWLDRCGKVSLTLCRLRGLGAEGGLLAISGANRIYLEDNVIDVYLEQAQELPAGLFDGFEIAALFSIPSREQFSFKAFELGERELAGLSQDERVSLSSKLLGRVEDNADVLTTGERNSYAAFARALRADPVNVALLGAHLLRIRDVSAIARSGTATAMIIADGNADTTLNDNHISGTIGLYGIAPPVVVPEEELKGLIADLAGRLKDGTVTLSGSTGVLQMRGNILGHVTITQKMLDRITQAVDPNQDRVILDGLFRAAFLAENSFEAAIYPLLAQSLSLTANTFDPLSGMLVATVVGETAISVGNRGHNNDAILEHVARDSAQNANLRVNVQHIAW